MAKLTARTVQTLAPDPDKRLEVPDTAMTGLYLVVQTSGSKGWALRYRSPATGKSVKLSLGKYPAMGLADARAAAREAILAIGRGVDPAAEKREAKAKAEAGADTFGGLFEVWYQRHASQKRWRSEFKRMIEKDVLPFWADRRLEDIRKRDAVVLLERIVDRGAPVQANRVLTVMKSMLSWAQDRDLVESNPFDRIRKMGQETTRDRVLSDDELVRVWAAAVTMGWPFGDIIRLLILTGQRRDEVAGLRWAELDLPGRMWTLPGERAKNGAPHQVFLAAPSVEILQSAPRLGAMTYSTTQQRPVSGWTRARGQAERLSGTTDWTFHDLRRTVATGMAKIGIAPHVTESVLNHKSGTIRGVAAVYNRHQYLQERERALTLWANYVITLAHGGDTSTLAASHG